MNLDLALVGKVLGTKDMSSATKYGAETPGLLGAEAQMYWDILMTHHGEFHEVPSVELFKTKAPSYVHVEVKDSIEAILHELKTHKLGKMMQEVLIAVSDESGDDPWSALQTLHQGAEHLSAHNCRNNNHYVMGSDKESTMRDLQRLESGGGLIGYPWPWEYFNKASQGLCKGNAIYVYGRHKSCKTFLMNYIALFYWKLGLKVLMFTREMSTDELKWRFIAIGCKLRYVDVLKGNLSTKGKEGIATFMDDTSSSGRLILTDIAEGIAGFKSTIEDIKPDIVLHDYFKAMADDAMDGKINGEHTYVARTVDQMKSYMMDKAKIPLIFCGHANREGERGTGTSGKEHAWSDHIVRRVDAAIRVITDEDSGQMALIVNAGRAIRKGAGLTVSCQLCETFGEPLAENYDWVKAFQQGDSGQRGSSQASAVLGTTHVPLGSTNTMRRSPGK